MTATPPVRQQLLANVAGIRDVVAAQWRAEEVGATLSAPSVAALDRNYLNWNRVEGVPARV
jgi:hypothetical protein